MRRPRSSTLAVLLALAGSAGPVAVDVSAAATAPALRVSASATRSLPVPLDGATVPDPAYVVLGRAIGATQVRFSVDGRWVRTDLRAPFDLVGQAADGTALPLRLAPGAHTVSATVTYSATVRRTVTARILVPAQQAPAPPSTRPFNSSSPFNAPIPAAPVLDPSSTSWAAQLGGGGRTQSALLDETGVAVYEADAATPRHQVRCTAPWGACPLSTVPVPVPLGARPASGPDGAMVVVDHAARRSYEFWQARQTADGGWEASWGSVNALDGDGYDPTGASPTGAGISRLAGVVRLAEIAAGRIDHALVFATGISARGAFRYPASKTDGINMYGSADPLPEGARIQLDPAVDVDVIPGITPAEKAVAKALQTYGAYNIDNGGYQAMGFSFETPGPGEPSTYAAAGLPWDYTDMPHIPWHRLRVLRQWDGR